MTSTTAEFLEGVPVAEILSSDAAAPFFSAFNKENPENATCFHCPSPGPQWASVSYGILLCLECSGAHRGLGVHISFVRSVNMDSWSGKQVRLMAAGGGNGKLRAYLVSQGIPVTDQREVRPVFESAAAATYKEWVKGCAEGTSQTKTAPDAPRTGLARSVSTNNSNVNTTTTNNNSSGSSYSSGGMGRQASPPKPRVGEFWRTDGVVPAKEEDPLAVVAESAWGMLSNVWGVVSQAGTAVSQKVASTNITAELEKAVKTATTVLSESTAHAAAAIKDLAAGPADNPTGRDPQQQQQQPHHPPSSTQPPPPPVTDGWDNQDDDNWE